MLIYIYKSICQACQRIYISSYNVWEHVRYPALINRQPGSYIYIYIYITILEAMLLKSSVCRAGNVSWVKNHRLPRITLCSEPHAAYYCDRETQKKRYKDCWKNSLIPVSLTIDDGSPYLKTVSSGVSQSTMLYIGSLITTKGSRKNYKITPSNQDQPYTCDKCGRTNISYKQPTSWSLFTKSSHDSQHGLQMKLDWPKLPFFPDFNSDLYVKSFSSYTRHL